MQVGVSCALRLPGSIMDNERAKLQKLYIFCTGLLLQLDNADLVHHQQGISAQQETPEGSSCMHRFSVK